jgi:hypothetical protein
MLCIGSLAHHGHLGWCLGAALACRATAARPEALFVAYPEERGLRPHFTLMLRIGILFD